MAAILLGLVRDGEPVAGLTWVPFTGERFTGIVGQPLRSNGVEQPPLAPAKLADSIVGVSTFNVDSRGRVPGRYRLAVIENLSRKCSRMRMHGATGIDLAYTAAGILGGAISFGAHVWDHAAGVALVRAAGGIVTELGRQRLDHQVALGAGRGARRARRAPRAPERPSAIRRTTDGPQRPRGPHHPVPGRRRRPGGQGRQLREPARRRRSRRAGRGLRRRGRRRADVPRRHRVVVRPGHHARRRQAHRRAGVHPAHRRRRRAHRSRTSTCCCARAPTRWRSTPPRSPVPSCWPSCPASSGRSASCCRSTPAPCRRASSRRRRAGRSPRTAAAAAPGSTPIEWATRGAELGVGEILLNSMDYDGTKAGFDLKMLRAVRGAVSVPVIASGGAGRGGTFRARRCCRCRRRAGRQRVPLPGADHRRGEGGDGGRRDRGAA